MIKCSPEAFVQCPTHQYCGDSPFKCEFEEGSDCDKFNQQIGNRPTTNADRIRSLSDETLAEKLYDIWRGEVERGDDLAVNWCHPDCCTSEDCDPDKHRACILRWLRSPAKEDSRDG